MVSSRKSLFSHAVAARDVAGELGCAYAVNRRLMALEVCKAREVRRRGTGGYVAGPCSV